MASEIKQIPSADKDLHLPYENGAGGADMNYVTSNAKTVAPESHYEHGGASPPTSTMPNPNALQEVEYAWVRVRRACQDGFSEFFGTMVMILFGDGVVAQVVLSGNTKGDYQSISWCWGIGVMLGVYVARKSGGHLNPAVTLSHCVFRKFPWRKFPIYLLAQLLGAMAGAFIVYGTYRGAIDAFEGGPGVRTVGLPTSSAGVFCTYPAPHLATSTAAMFWSEFVASALLMFCIYAFVDAGAGELLLPLCLFFLVFGIGAAWGWQTGYAINLARDFGPRLVSYMVGYGSEVWSAGGYYFWIPMVSPFLGCLFGGFLHDTFLYQGSTPINTPWMGLKRFGSAPSRMLSKSMSSNV